MKTININSKLIETINFSIIEEGNLAVFKVKTKEKNCDVFWDQDTFLYVDWVDDNNILIQDRIILTNYFDITSFTVNYNVYEKHTSYQSEFLYLNKKLLNGQND